jgi:thiamine pyrophosphate-dependent acetolactate synthase large subunit-like protein
MYVQRPEEIGDAVKEALAANGPVVIEIPVAEYFPPAAPTPGGAARH